MYSLPNTGETIVLGGILIGMNMFTWFGILLILIGIFRLCRILIKERTYRS